MLKFKYAFKSFYNSYVFFFQAEDGIRDIGVTEFRRVLFRSVFSWLEPGVYTIDDDIGLDAHVVCSTIGSEETPFLEEWVVTDDSLSFSIDPGDDVVCDWYTYPTEQFYRGGSSLPVA